AAGAAASAAGGGAAAGGAKVAAGVAAGATSSSGASPFVPPAGRGLTSLDLTLCALQGTVRLQFDADTGRVQYPPREVAAGSLSPSLEWRDIVDPHATVIATTVLRASGSAYTRQHLPWPLALIRISFDNRGGGGD